MSGWILAEHLLFGRAGGLSQRSLEFAAVLNMIATAERAVATGRVQQELVRISAVCAKCPVH